MTELQIYATATVGFAVVFWLCLRGLTRPQGNKLGGRLVLTMCAVGAASTFAVSMYQFVKLYSESRDLPPAVHAAAIILAGCIAMGGLVRYIRHRGIRSAAARNQVVQGMMECVLGASVALAALLNLIG